MAGSAVASPHDLPVADTEACEEHRAVQRILASRHFAKAPLLSGFLLYASRRALMDKVTRISEYEIGIQVFQRDSDFDPRQDNIVRTYARHLRKRLLEFYETDGREDVIRVELPKGSYVPVFQARETEVVRVGKEILEAEFEGGSETHGVLAKPRTKRFVWGLSSLLTVFAIVLLIWIIGSWRAPHAPVVELHRSVLHPLWTEIFRADRDTLVIPGDVGFVILQQANHRTFSLAEYLSWFSSHQSDGRLSMSYLKDETYTNVLNLSIVSNLQRLPEANGDRFIIRAAKDVRLDDLRNGNAILLGSNYSNPWDEVYSDKLNFHFVNKPDDSRFWIVNEHPQPGEAKIYESTTTNSLHRTYAVTPYSCKV
jgi:hypothetical protein